MNASEMFYWTVEKLTGAKKEEAFRTISCFFTLFFLLISYYMLKALRNSEFHSVFPPDWEPVSFLVTVFLSLGVTQIFNHFFDRIDMHRMLRYTYITVISCKVLLFVLLSTGAKWPVILFYFFGTVYFLLCIAVTWGSINFLFNPEQSKRCYGFIASGTMFGATAGTLITELFLSMQWRHELLLGSGAFLSLAMLFAHLSKRGLEEWTLREPMSKTPSQGLRIIREIKELMGHKFVRCIGIMVFALAVSNTVMNFQTRRAMDRSMCHNTFLEVYSVWNPAELTLKDSGFELIYGAKLRGSDLRTEEVEKFLRLHGLSIGADEFMSLHAKYRERLAFNYLSFWNSILKWVSILGLFLLIFCARFIFKIFGVRFASLVLPCFSLVGLIFLLGSPDLFSIQILLILAMSMDYSLNNATKEVFYTPTSPQTKGKYKPIIEGPLMRLGDFSAAVTRILCIALVPLAMQSWVYVGFGISIVLVWILAVWYAGTVFQKRESEDGPRFVIP
jgi:ATP/ADP translocase